MEADTLLDGVDVSRGTDAVDPEAIPAGTLTIGNLGSALLIILIALAGAFRIRRIQGAA